MKDREFPPDISLRDFFAAGATDRDIEAIAKSLLRGEPSVEVSRVEARYLHADEMVIARKSLKRFRAATDEEIAAISRRIDEGLQGRREKGEPQHGVNCEKFVHDASDGWPLGHAPEDDGEYCLVDVIYCGRCHTRLRDADEVRVDPESIGLSHFKVDVPMPEAQPPKPSGDMPITRIDYDDRAEDVLRSVNYLLGFRGLKLHDQERSHDEGYVVLGLGPVVGPEDPPKPDLPEIKPETCSFCGHNVAIRSFPGKYDFVCNNDECLTNQHDAPFASLSSTSIHLPNREKAVAQWNAYCDMITAALTEAREA